MLKILLIFFFLIAIALRFLYFPENIYFGFDQARDAFVVQDILQGDLKVVGPPTGVEGLFHGPLYYYLYAPFYYFFQGDPAAPAAFLRIANSLGIFLVFLVGTFLFNKKVGLFSALLFAVSFEQTQFALYFNHPSLAVLSVMLFYLGLIRLLFNRNQKGLILTAVGLGLSLHFEFVLIYLFVSLAATLIIFRKLIPKIDKSVLVSSLLFFVLITSSFLLTEIKFNFRTLTNLPSLLSATGSAINIGQYFNNFYLLTGRFVNDNLFSHPLGTNLVLALLMVSFLLFFKKSKAERSKLLLLLLWMIGGIIPYINNKSATPLYYYSVGASVGLIIFYSFLLSKVGERFKIFVPILLILPIFSNINLIRQNNILGVLPTINVQSGMLLGDEKGVVDYIYQHAEDKKLAVRAISMPLSVNTTWSYLFEWYGKSKYGYLPTWIGPIAEGYAGNLKVVDSRSDLPQKQFFIIESTRGIRSGLIADVVEDESYFTNVIDEKEFGQLKVQTRTRF